jgi:hypothetical protein
MPWKKSSSEVSLVPPSSKHRVTSWVDEQNKTVVYVFYSAPSSAARVAEWDYEEQLEEDDTVWNRIRDAIGANRKTTQFAGNLLGETQRTFENTELPHDVHAFDRAIEYVQEEYDVPE